jgi:amino acid adenylation domain-containing protein
MPVESRHERQPRVRLLNDFDGLREARKVTNMLEQRRRNMVEDAIVDAWAQVFGASAVRPDADFFELGGTSLLATMMASRVLNASGVKIPVRTFFDHSTLEDLTRAAGAVAHAAPTITTLTPVAPVDREARLRLSASQERMWFLQQIDPGGTAYNLGEAMRLTGPLDGESLQWAFDQLSERHESLRTSFVTDNGMPVQRIAPPGAVGITMVDCQSVPASEQLAHVIGEMQRVATTPFDLTRPPLIRVLLFRLAEDDHVLFIGMHHIVSDQWSFGLLSRELSALYNAHHAGRTEGLDELTYQHADFASWHWHRLENGTLDEQLVYWSEQLKDLAPGELPTDRVRPSVRGSRGAAIIAPFPDDLAARVQALARQHRATPFMVLLACYQVLLHRYTHTDDVAVGAPLANRNTTESEPLISSFVNTVVIRTDLSGEPTFHELVGRVRAVALDAFDHQDLPFDRLVSELRPPRDPSRTPFFQAFFNLQNVPLTLPTLDGLTVESIPFEGRSAQFDVSLTVDTEWSRTITLDFSTDLFERGRMERMLGHYVTLLDAALTHPETSIEDLPMLTAAELAELQASELATRVDHDTERSVHLAVADRARLTPDAVAVRFGERQLKYAELDRRANQLAHHLVALGVNRGDRVGIHVERSPEMIVALLATFKAGAAYVPLDPGFPTNRLDFMLEDSGTALLVTTADLAEARPTAWTNVVVQLDADAAVIAEHPETAPDVPTAGTDVAYVIYTSGSTGQPKGVQIEHRNLTNFLASMAEMPGLDQHDVLLSVTTLSFDISVLEIFLPLVRGAQVVLVDRETTLNPSALRAAIERCSPTIMQATPTMWRMLVDARWTGRDGLKILCGGEPMPADLAAALLERCSELWNMYGPTETTVWSTAKRIEAGFDKITIGTPIDNTTVHILDGQLRPLPVGVPGELFIGGDGVARGYLNRPELTAERFIGQPGAAGKRLYRTGDLAQRLPDGDIELLGRIDHQVKVRGHRIELAEIEAALATHSAVSQAIVTTHEFSPGDTRLVAYYTHLADAPATSELRSHLQAVLPSYMIPSSYIALEAFPLTPNKKINRGALPTPTAPRTGSIDDPPRPGIESEIAAIWRDVLGVPAISRHDDFFELGGHSLVAVRVFARIEQLTGKTYPVTSLFRASTVAGFAELLRDEGWRTNWTSLVPVQPTGRRRPYFVVCPFRITALSFADLGRLLGPDQPLYAIQPQGMDTDAPPHHSVEEMASHYITEMREVQRHGPYAIGGHCAGNWVALEMARQLQEAGERVRPLILVDSEPPGITPPHRHRLHHLAQRTLHYLRDGRFRHAVRWQIGLARERLLAARAPSHDRGRVAVVRAAHAAAHAVYGGATFDGDAVFIRSEESAQLNDKDWHLRWADVITGELHVEIVPGTHATLLQPGPAAAMADVIAKALAAPA